MRHVSEEKAGEHDEPSDSLRLRLLTTMLRVREFEDRVPESYLRGMTAGAQHSQRLESLLVHIPGMRVVMPSNPEEITEAASGLVKRRRR